MAGAGPAEGAPMFGGAVPVVVDPAGTCCKGMAGAPPIDGATAAGARPDGCTTWAEAVDAAGAVIARPQNPRTNGDRTRMRELLSPVRSWPRRHPASVRAGIRRTQCGEWWLGLTVLRGPGWA